MLRPYKWDRGRAIGIGRSGPGDWDRAIGMGRSGLDLLVDEDAQQDTDEGEEVHLQSEAEGDFQEPEIKGHRGAEAGMYGLSEDILDDAGREDRKQDFPQ